MTFSHDDIVAAEDEGGGGFANEYTTPRVGGVMEDETEDEEVKVNCMHGVQNSEQSSGSESDDFEEESDEDDPEQDTEEPNVKHGLVQFVTSQQTNGFNIQRPRAVLGIPVSQEQSFQGIEERDDNNDDESSMDESSDDDDDSSTDSGHAIGMSLEATKLDDSDNDEESVSDASSRYSEDVSSACGVAGSDSESDDSDDDDEEEEEDGHYDDVDVQDAPNEEAVEDDNNSEDEMMSDDDSAASVPLECFKHCDSPSDVVELETALQEREHGIEEEATSVSSDDSDVDLQDPTLQSALLCDIVELETKPSIPNGLTHAKRVLSSSALLGPASSSSSNLTMLSPKRVCLDARANSDDDELPSFLSMGQPAYQCSQKVSLSDDDDEEQDRQLSEELEAAEIERERENTPVPLLTPPSSPLRVESGDEGDVTVCEWPCNLAVDSAMTATMDLRPPSPQNLQTWEQQEEERLMRADTLVSPKPTLDQGKLSSTLTPMMRGISMEIEAPTLRL